MNASRPRLALLLLCLVPLGVEAQNAPSAGAEDAGFESIFDGKTLTHWEGDPRYWRVENGWFY